MGSPQRGLSEDSPRACVLCPRAAKCSRAGAGTLPRMTRENSTDAKWARGTLRGESPDVQSAVECAIRAGTFRRSSGVPCPPGVGPGALEGRQPACRFLLSLAGQADSWRASSFRAEDPQFDGLIQQIKRADRQPDHGTDGERAGGGANLRSAVQLQQRPSLVRGGAVVQK
jgi:hypothetical protein